MSKLRGPVEKGRRARKQVHITAAGISSSVPTRKQSAVQPWPLGGVQGFAAVQWKEAAVQLGAAVGNREFQRLITAVRPETPVQRADGEPKSAAGKDDSHRFEGDKKLEEIFSGSDVLKRPNHGMAVVKLQQALIDMGYLLAKFGVDGKFGKETEAALKKFQSDKSVPPSGELDKATIEAMNATYDTRKPYLDNAKFDPAHPERGTRALTEDEKKEATNALVPQRGAGGGASTFQDDVGGKKYGDEIQAALTKIIASLHKELFEDKAALRADPAKNFHDWSVMEKPAEAAKDQTDALYSSYATGPKMTHAAGNFIDQWEDEETRNAALSEADKKQKATDKVWYLIASNCTKVSKKHSAVPGDSAEKGILTPIVEGFVDTKTKVQTMLDLDIGWEGAQLQGIVYLQRFKQSTDEKNRAQLWELFHTCIHEYMHTLAHEDYLKYANKFNAKGDSVRYNTLIEGFCDFFTVNVRKTITVSDALRQKIEGPFYDVAAPVPAVTPAVYPSIAQAEQTVAITGIRNAESAYFKGKVKLIGAK